MEKSDILKILLEYRQWERHWMMFDNSVKGIRRPLSFEEFILGLEKKYVKKLGK